MTMVNIKFDHGQRSCQTGVMKPAVQQRTLKTRARLLGAAEEVVQAHGFEALRVDQVVSLAGVAKGTFFAHFTDKDALMSQLIGARINAALDRIEAQPTPVDVDEIVQTLVPLMALMTHERYVFDVILRHSGAALVEDVGPIAETFGRFLTVIEGWLAGAPVRQDVPVAVLAEGVQAFFIQAIALHFCALHSDVVMDARLTPWLRAWLVPQGT
ncbi:putative HTH-type transcriptional regulator YvdT [Pseudosulfitobacter pseudonitzschiae]|uniref:Putative HTH-type transcriptional regulator YvdT n=2 Tax=Rhodobacterales TaxID=204455 RepID=A0A221K5K7_9RHOB|nr:putative HTH-type transcriptional regulator YvdT [Pseudosulfitobacter pseudonitzschiae]